MRLIYTGLSIAVVMQAGVFAAQAQSPTGATPAGQGAATATVTVTGCLQSADAGSTGASADSAEFVLTNAVARADAVQPSPAATRAAPGDTPGSAGAAAGTSGAEKPVSRYIVHGRAEELSKHAGQRVEIVGAASALPPPPAGAPATQVIPHEPHRGPVSTVAAPASAADPSVRHLKVQSVRMVAAACQ